MSPDSENEIPDSTDNILLHSTKTFIQKLNRNQKRLILVIADGVVLSASLLVAMVLRLGELEPAASARLVSLYGILPVFGIIVFWFLGLYHFMIRSLSLQVTRVLALGTFLIALALPAYAYFEPDAFIPRSVPILYALIAFIGIGLIRVTIRIIYDNFLISNKKSARLLIYGAGEMGRQTASMLANNPEYRLLGFMDDDPSLQGVKIRGMRVYNPDRLNELKQRFQIEFVLLAMAKISPTERRAAVAKIAQESLPLKSIPPMSELLDGKSIGAIKEVSIEDLLGRETVTAIPELINDNIRDNIVLVTGAAGSIGSQLCRQILESQPKKLIAFDHSEFGLYTFERSLLDENTADFINEKIVFRLGSVTDRNAIKRTLSEFNVDLVYHAAAYKHVPLVEENAVEAVKNNIFGTQVVCEEAVLANVKRFVLVSTDKAVRPTSVMGATKRVAELVVQNLHTKSKNTVISMVRFGNVLGSSGSVIPLFKDQIANGGPVTLTHPEVTRYFMTISEAAQLVLQSGFLAEGGEVFLLDMGEPVKLKDLAKLMIKLSGKTVLEDGEVGEGIPVKVIGLRPGEKLYEELLVDDNAVGTPHPKIMKAVEKKLSSKQLAILLNELEECVDTLNNIKAGQILHKEMR